MSSKLKDRRAFLKQMMTGSLSFQVAPPLFYFVDSILKSAIAAEFSSGNPRRFVSIQQPQAPARWMFDMFLVPYASASEANAFNPQNQMVGTRFREQSGRNQVLAYESTFVQGIHAPYMWKFDIPTRHGDRPMSDLLTSMLSLQGINTTNAGHGVSRKFHYLPLGAESSLGALPSDLSSLPLGNVALQVSDFVFKSGNYKSPLISNIFSGNKLQTLLTPFITPSNSNQFLDTGISAPQTNFQKLNRLLNSQVLDSNQKKVVHLINKTGASEVMLDGFSDLSTYWTSRLAAYNALIAQALDQTKQYEGINDFPVGQADVNNRDSRYAFNGKANIVKFDDLNELFNASTFGIENLAPNLIVAEYLILNDLSQSVCVSVAGLTGIKVQSGMNNADKAEFDEHDNGMFTSPLANFWYYRAVASCLYEFCAQLKSKQIQGTSKTYFDETIIELFGEFQRNPRADGSGSDHGFLGKSITYLSGGIQGPVVVGALGSAPLSDASGPGVWGQGTVDPNLKTHVTNSNAVATTANLLRVPSPVKTAAPMAVVDSTGAVTPIAIKTRVV